MRLIRLCIVIGAETPLPTQFRNELPLLGFPKIAPLPFKACRVLSKHSSRRRCTLGARLPSLTHGPSSSFLTTSTVYSASHPAGLLHPAAGCGVRHVSGYRRRPSPMQAPVCAFGSTLPQWRLTLRSVPLGISSNHVTVTDSLSLFQLALVPIVRRKRRTPDSSAGQPTSGLCSAAESVASPPTLPPARCPILPWASNHQGSARQRCRPRCGPAPTPQAPSKELL